jgi:hypothetical protein
VGRQAVECIPLLGAQIRGGPVERGVLGAPPARVGGVGVELGHVGLPYVL